MITIADALAAIFNHDALQTELANLKRENADLRQRLTGETMRANEQQAKADFYYAMHTESQIRKEHR